MPPSSWNFPSGIGVLYPGAQYVYVALPGLVKGAVVDGDLRIDVADAHDLYRGLSYALPGVDSRAAIAALEGPEYPKCRTHLKGLACQKAVGHEGPHTHLSEDSEGRVSITWERRYA